MSKQGHRRDGPADPSEVRVVHPAVGYLCVNTQIKPNVSVFLVAGVHLVLMDAATIHALMIDVAFDIKWENL